jgi:hypothetical protein
MVSLILAQQLRYHSNSSSYSKTYIYDSLEHLSVDRSDSLQITLVPEQDFQIVSYANYINSIRTPAISHSLYNFRLLLSTENIRECTIVEG